MTNYHNHSDSLLADEIGALDREMKALDKRLKEAKAEFKRRSLEEAAGEKYAVRSTTAVRISLDAKRIKAEMGETWTDMFSRLSEVTSLRISAA